MIVFNALMLLLIGSSVIQEVDGLRMVPIRKAQRAQENRSECKFSEIFSCSSQAREALQNQDIVAAVDFLNQEIKCVLSRKSKSSDQAERDNLEQNLEKLRQIGIDLKNCTVEQLPGINKRLHEITLDIWNESLENQPN